MFTAKTEFTCRHLGHRVTHPTTCKYICSLTPLCRPYWWKWHAAFPVPARALFTWARVFNYSCFVHIQPYTTITNKWKVESYVIPSLFLPTNSWNWKLLNLRPNLSWLVCFNSLKQIGDNHWSIRQCLHILNQYSHNKPIINSQLK